MNGQRYAPPSPVPPGKRPGTHYTGGWVGTRSGLNGCEKSRPNRDSIPGSSTLIKNKTGHILLYSRIINLRCKLFVIFQNLIFCAHYKEHVEAPVLGIEPSTGSVNGDLAIFERASTRGLLKQKRDSI